jgi:chromate reductase, NAD(P)H dehydrogenase (quinone)
MITIIAGTNRPQSNTLKLAHYYHNALDQRGISSEVISLTELPAEFIVSDLYGKRSEMFKPIQEKISAGTKFLFIVPEYNGGFPGILKTFIDGCTFPDSFYGKKSGINRSFLRKIWKHSWH